MKRSLILLTLLCLLVSLSACGAGIGAAEPTQTAEPAPAQTPEPTDAPYSPPDVSLTVWAPADYAELAGEMISGFSALYGDRANFDINLETVEAEEAADALLSGEAPDVFVFSGGSLSRLINAGALEPLTLDAGVISAESSAGMVAKATADGVLYAAPLSFGDGSVMYYNTDILDEYYLKGIKTMTQVLAYNRVDFAVDLSDPAVLWSFFNGAGLGMGYDENGEAYCDWNSTEEHFTGKVLVDTLLGILRLNNFTSVSGARELADAFAAEEVGAAISTLTAYGPVSEALGGNFGVIPMTKFTMNGDSVVLSTCVSYEYVGVSSAASEPGWAMLLARMLSDGEAQQARYDRTGKIPANLSLMESVGFAGTPAYEAFLTASETTFCIEAPAAYRDAATELGEVLMAKNPDRIPLQTLLDDFVAKVLS